MLPKSTLPQLIITRVSGTLKRLERDIWSRHQDLSVEASRPQQEQVSLTEAKGFDYEPIAMNHSWGRLFDQRWCKVCLGEPADGDSWLFWMDQGEATLYIDGQAYFGLNVAHHYCRLPEGAQELWIQSSCIQSGIWHPDASPMKLGSFFEDAYLAKRNDSVWHAYHDLKCLFDLAMDQRKRENPQAPDHVRSAGFQPLVDHYSPSFRLILRIMEDAIDVLETEGVDPFRKALAKGYKALKMDKSFSTCVLTGHAHLDLVWIWPERMGELKAINVFATANHLMEQYPEYRFAYSQAASYEAVEKREPKLYDTVKGRIASGKWQATGAMQVESDTIFACGEALARSFIIGQQGFERINGNRAKLTWLPDVFGYAACLPQIMQQTGVDYFFTTKMTWNAINRFPYSSFIWRGHDGSEVLAHVTQEVGYVNHMEVHQFKKSMHGNQQGDLFEEYLLPVGYGDGGGGPTDVMLERARRLNALPGMPEIKWDQPESFFDRLKSASDRLPVYQGECYLEYHRGTYTTHSNLKAIFRKLERAMQVAEAVSVATGKTWDMENSWKKLIFAQFHDYIPGSSVWDVYLEDLPEMDKHADAQLLHAKSTLGDSGEASLFNPHALRWSGWHKPEAGESIWVNLSPLSGTPMAQLDEQAPDAPVINGNTLSNGLSTLEMDENGWISKLELEGKTIPQTGPLGQLILYVDRTAFYEAWDIDRQALSLGTVCDTSAEVKSFEKKHSAGFVVTRSIGEKSTASVCFELEAGKSELRISIELDWQEPEHLLKIHFPTDFRATNCRCGIPFGSILRPQQPGSMQAEAMWEIPFSRHLSVFDEGERSGLSVLSESKYGASVRNGSVGISLVRSARVTGFDVYMKKAWPEQLSQYGQESKFSDIGQHTIQLALTAYAIDLPRERQPAALAETLFTEPIAYQGQPIPSLIEPIEGDDTLIPCWTKPAIGGGWILRLHEVAGQRGSIRLRPNQDARISLTRLDESMTEKIDSGGPITFKPYEVLSILVR